MPWTYARTWHKALWALYDLGENADRVILTQTALIEQQSEEIQSLRAQLKDSAKYHDVKNATIHGLEQERNELLDAGENVAECYRKYWVKSGNGPTTPPSVCRWNSVVERHGL